MLAIKEIYRYEYLGDCTQPVMYKSMERTIYNFISSYAMKVTRYYFKLSCQLGQDIYNRYFSEWRYSILPTFQVFPVLKGGYSSGKSTCIQESARLMGQNLVFRTITYLTDFHILELVRDEYY